MDQAWLLEGLSDTQRAAVTSDATPLCILAGPGSGKTRVLTRRIAYRVANGQAFPEHVLALTFSRKAAGELRHRLTKSGVEPPVAAGTFHAVALAQLRRWWEATGRRPPTIVAKRERRLVAALTASDAGAVSRDMVQAADAEVGWAKARLVTPDEYGRAARTAGRESPIAFDHMAAVYARYQLDNRRRGVIDLDDLLWRCAEALEADTAFAAAQRWQWRHFFVDEYQDVNPAHLRLLQGWLGDRADLCVVGDPDQAIYGWNGGDAGEIQAFRRRFPTGQTIEIGENFRSSPEILGAAVAVLDRRHGTAGQGITAETLPALRCCRDSGLAPTVTDYDDDDDEACGVSRGLRDHHAPGTSWKRQAVLARTNAQLDVMARALTAAGIPHRIRGGRPLLDRPAVRLLLWRCLVPEESLATANRGDDRSTGRSGIAPPITPPGRNNHSRRVPTRALLAEVNMALASPADLGVASPPGGEAPMVPAPMGDPDPTAVAELDALAAALGEFGTLRPDGSVAEFMSWMEAAERIADAPGGDAVELATFHRAKGLEWDVVFLVGLEDGLVPLTRQRRPAPTDEERRLLFVAMTRARDELHCSWAHRRRFGDHLVVRAPSPFLAAIAEVVDDTERLKAPVDPRGFVRTICEELAVRPGPTDLPGRDQRLDRVDRAGLVDELRRWRSTMARAAAVGEGAVLTDRTIDALVGHMPTTAAEVAAVPGMGRFAADRWGPALVDVVRRHLSAS